MAQLHDINISHTTKAKANGMLNKNTKLTKQPRLVLLYTLLYRAFLGSVIQPIPLGALNPRLWRMTRLTEVRAAIRLVRDGMRNPNFIYQFCLLRLIHNRTNVFANALNECLSFRHFHFPKSYLKTKLAEGSNSNFLLIFPLSNSGLRWYTIPWF